MAIYHVHFVCALDYMARRLPFRPAHLKQLKSLRDDGRVGAGGPEPDGRAANISYRVVDRAELDRLVIERKLAPADRAVPGHLTPGSLRLGKRTRRPP